MPGSPHEHPEEMKQSSKQLTFLLKHRKVKENDDTTNTTEWPHGFSCHPMAAISHMNFTINLWIKKSDKLTVPHEGPAQATELQTLAWMKQAIKFLNDLPRFHGRWGDEVVTKGLPGAPWQRNGFWVSVLLELQLIKGVQLREKFWLSHVSRNGDASCWYQTASSFKCRPSPVISGCTTISAARMESDERVGNKEAIDAWFMWGKNRPQNGGSIYNTTLQIETIELLQHTLWKTAGCTAQILATLAKLGILVRCSWQSLVWKSHWGDSESIIINQHPCPERPLCLWMLLGTSRSPQTVPAEETLKADPGCLACANRYKAPVAASLSNSASAFFKKPVWGSLWILGSFSILNMPRLVRLCKVNLSLTSAEIRNQMCQSITYYMSIYAWPPSSQSWESTHPTRFPSFGDGCPFVHWCYSLV